jgi:hypothetical protein
LKKRDDSPGYPGDERITQRYNQPKEMVRSEQQELPEAELEHVMGSTHEDAVRRYVPIRGRWACYSVECEENKLTRPELAEQSNVPAREYSGEWKRGERLSVSESW